MMKLGTPFTQIMKWVNSYTQTFYSYDKMSNPLHEKTTHLLMTKSGTPSIHITEWVNPYTQTFYPYDEMYNALHKKITHP